MTIGRSSKKQKAPRSPPYLDRASGFYGRLDEIESDFRTEAQIPEKQAGANSVAKEMISVELHDDQEHWVSDFSEGMMEDDGTTLLKRKPSRLSRRWSRKSSRRYKSDKSSLEMESQSTETEVAPGNITRSLEVHLEPQADTGSGYNTPQPKLIHFSIREEADDQKLIPKGKERQNEMEENRKEGEVEGKTDVENMKVVKRSSARNYRKVRYHKVIT